MEGIAPLDAQTVRNVIEGALADARGATIVTGARHLHAHRSLAFVEAFAVRLEAAFDRDDVHVFRKTRRADLFDRGGGGRRSEFLFDALACQVGYVAAPVHRGARPIGFVRSALVQVESEFALDVAASCEDFSKLVCGAARQSVFVGPLTRPEHYLAPLGEIARHVQGECFVALVPHPASWGALAEVPQLHRWDGTGWAWV